MIAAFLDRAARSIVPPAAVDAPRRPAARPGWCPAPPTGANSPSRETDGAPAPSGERGEIARHPAGHSPAFPTRSRMLTLSSKRPGRTLGELSKEQQ